MNFGPQTAKNRTVVSTYSINISDAHISRAKSMAPKISQLVEDYQRLLIHTSLGMGLPATIFNAWNSHVNKAQNGRGEVV